jgi:hypothetical protein
MAMNLFNMKPIIVNKKWFLSLFVILIIVGHHSVFAQAPGFLGKRFFIGIEAPMFASPGLLRGQSQTYYSYSNTGQLQSIENKYGKFEFRIKPTLTLEYVLNRKTSFQGFIRFYTLSTDVSAYQDTIHEYGEVKSVTFYPTERVQMNATSFGGKFKFFGKSHINPVGAYFSIGLEYSIQNFKYSENNFQGSTGSRGVFTRNPYYKKSSNLIVTGGFGNQYALSNNLLLNLGLDFGLPLTNYWSVNKNGDDLENFTDRTSAKPISRFYLVNINIGLSLAP